MDCARTGKDHFLLWNMRLAAACRTGFILPNKNEPTSPPINGTCQKLSVDGALKLGIDVADGLATLHERDIVHRDLSPSNILFDQEDRAMVADLGGGAVTPWWIDTTIDVVDATTAPREIRIIVARSMITLTNPSPRLQMFYALGKILFEALTGRKYSLHVGERAKSLRADIPAWLDDILIQMLAEDPKKRLQKRISGGSYPQAQMAAGLFEAGEMGKSPTDSQTGWHGYGRDSGIGIGGLRD